MKVTLTRGKFAIIDTVDVPLVDKYCWLYLNAGYAYCYFTYKKHALMHRLIMSAPEGKQIDHINGDRLDNRRSNLRICTPQENICNWHSVIGKSKYKGVSWCKIMKKWLSKMKHNGDVVLHEYYDDEVNAAKSYDIAVQKFRDILAKTNFPPSNNQD